MSTTLCLNWKVLLELGSSRKAGPRRRGQKQQSSLTHTGLPLQPVQQGLAPLPKSVVQHPLHLPDHLEGRAQRLVWSRGSTPSLRGSTLVVWPLWPVPSPGAARSPPAPSSSAACPGAASAVQPVAAEPGTEEAAPSLDHSSGGGGEKRMGERRGTGCHSWPRGSA